MLTLHEGEQIIAKVRKHWLVFLVETFGFVVAAILPIGLLLLPTRFVSDLLPTFTDGQVGAFLAFVFLTWEAVAFMAFMTLLTTYYLDVIIVTNKRILDIDQVGLFTRDIAGLPIENLEDITIRTEGILAEIFRFGSLDIQTAGDIKEVSITGVHHPERARDIIMKAYEKDRAEKGKG